jgi:ribosomal protein S18 acetylase RimI-like enzyme
MPKQRVDRNSDAIVIQRACAEDELHMVRELLVHYIDEQWQVLSAAGAVISQASPSPDRGARRDLDSLPGPYGSPGGCLLLARAGADPVGCVALTRVDSLTCEMKRLYVKPTHRRRGVGRELALAVIEEARTLGYELLRLDVIEVLAAAPAFYRSLGFQEIPPFDQPPAWLRCQMLAFQLSLTSVVKQTPSV